ncbi:MAG: hypothetical protein ACR2K3_03335 [Nocardioides sp.]
MPVDRPFTLAQARAEGVSRTQLAAWVSDGLLIHPMRGVFHAAQLPDGLDLRLSCLALVVPDDAVVTDRTAGWAHGASMILAPGDHLRVPAVSMHLYPGSRLRNPLAQGGERAFLPREVVEIEGLAVTSKLRTTIDLGRGLRRESAFAAMCSIANVADFDREELNFEVRERGRFAGYRGVRQARALALLVRTGYGSPPECVLGLSWEDQPGMPPLRLQHPVAHPGGTYFLDLSCPELRYGAEYNGPRWHGEERAAYDADRVAWLVEDEGWIIDIFETDDVYGRGREPGLRLRMGIERARRRFGSLSWTGQNRYGESWLG